MFRMGWQFVQEAYQMYTAYGVTQLLLISSLVFILITDNKSENIQLIYYIISVLLIILFPPIAYVLAKYFIGQDVYWRIFWLLPSSILIAFVGTRVFERLKKQSKKNFFLIAFLFVIILGGKNIFNSNNYAKSYNIYKLPEEVVQICEMVAPNEGKTKMIVPETIVSYIRQYNPNINLLYGRNLGKDSKKGKKYKILLQLNSSEPDVGYIAKYAIKKECKYILFEKSSTGLEEIENYGYALYGKTDNYIVFKLSE